jgi:hypothetical protein
LSAILLILRANNTAITAFTDAIAKAGADRNAAISRLRPVIVACDSAWFDGAHHEGDLWAALIIVNIAELSSLQSNLSLMSPVELRTWSLQRNVLAKPMNPSMIAI